MEQTSKKIKIDETADKALAFVVDAALKRNGLEAAPHYTAIMNAIVQEETEKHLLLDQKGESSLIALCDFALRHMGWQMKPSIDLIERAVEIEEPVSSVSVS